MFIKDVNGTCHAVSHVLTVYVTGSGSTWLVRLDRDSAGGGGSFDLTATLSTQAAAEVALDKVVNALGVVRAA